MNKLIIASSVKNFELKVKQNFFEHKEKCFYNPKTGKCFTCKYIANVGTHFQEINGVDFNCDIMIINCIEVLKSGIPCLKWEEKITTKKTK
jgi:hypothetical protein